MTIDDARGPSGHRPRSEGVAAEAGRATAYGSDAGVIMKNSAWWQRAVIYQVYPRSFQDSNGTALAISTGYRNGLSTWSTSGLMQFGSRPSFPRQCGTLGMTSAITAPSIRFSARLRTLTRCLQSAHARGLKVILDFVPNHTSDQHPWFQESRSSKLHPKRDWYVWRDAKPDGSPPNNWESEFGGPAWTFDEADRPILLPRVPEGAA